jgi:hypothetical protein
MLANAPAAQDESRAAERWFYADWLNAPWFRAASAKRAARDAAADATSTDSAAEDAPAPPQPQPGAPDEPYRDTEPAFWSLDNPVVATGALVCGMVALAALQH